jgi:hypothetical protein
MITIFFKNLVCKKKRKKKGGKKKHSSVLRKWCATNKRKAFEYDENISAKNKGQETEL